jgi:hypothetical protein
VGLKTLTGEIRPASGRDHLWRILGMLAVIGPVDLPGSPGVRLVSR